MSDQENFEQDDEQEDVEAHKTSIMRPTLNEPDVEGHKLAESEDEGDDDVEAHRVRADKPVL